MRNGGDFFKGFLVGGLIGAIMALLYAPKSGKETREDISKKTEEFAQRAKEEYEAALEKSKKTYRAAIDRLKNLENVAQKKVEEVEDQIQELAEKSLAKRRKPKPF